VKRRGHTSYNDEIGTRVVQLEQDLKEAVCHLELGSASGRLDVA
jgi:hypothetical protein